MSTYYAHSSNSVGALHRLSDHLESVSALAERFASIAPWKDEAGLAGALHDLGKYGDRFQARLRGETSGVDHWSQGAWIALKEHLAIAAALAIEGHHVGLQAASGLRRLVPENLLRNHPFRLQLSDTDFARVMARAAQDGLMFRHPASCALRVTHGMEKAIAAMLDVRMLFSCLVDADFLDTEAHFEGNSSGKRYRDQGPVLNTDSASAALDRFVNQIRADSEAHKHVRAAREALWRAAIESAHGKCGVYTLTAPTGSGKTLVMLKFALEHAAHHGLKRIVVAVPFLTIIEQTAAVYRAVFEGFPADFVVEHHSLAGLGSESARGDAEEDQDNLSDRQRRLLSQNWDAPLVLTTNVQLLESLFSNRPSSCRKLHNLMESVILFDEAQSLPQHLAVPTLAALSHLSAAYRSTVLFATATQPAFETLDDAVTRHAVSGWQPFESVPESPALFAALKRVEVRWPKFGETRGWTELVDELRDAAQVLCVVNLKRHARELLEELAGEEGVVHLSTNLCPEHRRLVLENVRAQLRRGTPCRLVSTQCVEAGVDVDFPHVYRALAPLEAIAQAAGRCNREGRMTVPGRVMVFEPDIDGDWRRRYPTYVYYQATEVTRTMLELAGDLDINDPTIFRDYYRRLYDVNDPANQNAELKQAITSLDFPEIARLYRFIDKDAIQVLAPWAAKQHEFEALQAEADKQGISAGWMRRAQGLAVSIYRPRDRHPAWGVLIPARFRRGGISDEWFILQDPRREFYDDLLGLKLPESDLIFIA